ncbi:MAG: type II secretion system protein E [Candidatus Omnitrophica bacterium CG11_big_fil_rev_8_21_14_0_20_42_13]|uniref:Type II secretion system protein E n=1 Tax=Candidatus Ghiorseimicrobium undicola TaxID=1974746 RepID=A0A2H0LWU3_9BACT|nr:MAG: type II secretion system protein E [Candidatus Omnitrophica bacterium CG11_big_fil_rev_8_21_14_0_20_42_13]
MEKIKDRIRERLIAEYLSTSSKDQWKEETLRRDIQRVISELGRYENIDLSREETDSVIRELIDDLLGLGPIREFMDDPEISEIMVNGPDKIYIERAGNMVLSKKQFKDINHLMTIMHKIISPTRRRVDESNPYVDVCFMDGSRVNIILPPVSLTGPVITIRKFLSNISGINDLIKLDTLTKPMADFLSACIKARLNILFSGATGTGKTTTLSVLSSHIDARERIITIEDTAEIRLRQEHVVRLEARSANVEGKGEISIGDLFKNSLRMRPRRLILGEIRGSEALDMLQAASSGHSGCLAVLHASSPQDVISRIETMILTTNSAFPMWAVKKQISSSIDLILHHDQLADGSRKITHVTEVGGIKGEEVELHDLYSYSIDGLDDSGKVMGKWKAHARLPDFYNKFIEYGIKLPKDIFNKAE